MQLGDAPLAARFAEAMDRLGPFGRRPHLAVAVSGGADSSALAVLAQDWAVGRGGSVTALIADHGLRPESGVEAALTATRMEACGIGVRIIRLDIAPGAALQERARTARHAALAAEAAAVGAVHLLFGHHAADQAEGIAMRAARGTGGAAGMAAWSARRDIVLLRPLLDVAPAALRAELSRRGLGWIEDPSNQDQRFERVRLRGVVAPRPTDAAARALETAQHEASAFLAAHARLMPAGFALLRADRAPPDALAALIRCLGGAVYPARRDSIERLAGAVHSATLGGVQIMPAGRFGPGWLLCREPAACAPPVAARADALWDRRFRIRAVPGGADALGALGAAAPDFRDRNGLPSVVLRGLPAFFRDGAVVAVPHCQPATAFTLDYQPPAPVAALAFNHAAPGGADHWRVESMIVG
ncbi:tRNA lysidine(34) synthetase TilS [Acidiphilium sp.]|uniref:tRNA lysidine(34) synthetase TilS n=1 Tax=Acidiphilium sp. TaxID=527 RepID=UPI003D085EA2